MKRPRRFSCFVSPGPLGSHRSLQRLPNPARQAFARHPTRIVGRSEGEGPRWRVCTNGRRSEDPHTTRLGSSPFRLLIYCLVTHRCRSSPLNQSFGPFIEPKSNGKFNLSLPYLPSVFTISLLAPPLPMILLERTSLFQVLSLKILSCGACLRLRERVHIFTWFVQLKFVK